MAPQFGTALALNEVSLSQGWTVELGIGDAEAIADVGLYDTDVYADPAWSGTWIDNPALGVAGTFQTGLSVDGNYWLNYLDDGGGDRRAELLATPVGSMFQVVGAGFTQQYEVVTVNDLPATSRVQIIVDPRIVIPSNVGQPATFTSFAAASVYGSDAPFGYLLDVTSLTRSINTRRGRDRFTSRFRTGVASVVLDDNDGFFTPPAGIQPPIGVLPLRPGREVQITYKEAVVFSGFIDSFDSRSSKSGDITTIVKASDRFAAFNRNDLPAVADVGAGDTTPERMQRLLDHFLSDGTMVQFRGTPFATMQATTMGQPLLTELQLVADSEGGACYIDALGNVIATSFAYYQDLIDAGPTWVVGGGGSPIKIWNSDSEWAVIRILNEAHMSRVDGTEQVKVNVESQDIYGRRTHTRLDLQNDADDQVAVIAQRLVDFAGVDRQRITELQFVPEPDTPTADMAVTADFGDVFQVTINTLWGWSYTVVTALFGIEHTVTPQRWTTTLRTDDTLFDQVAAAFQRASFDNDAFS